MFSFSAILFHEEMNHHRLFISNQLNKFRGLLTNNFYLFTCRKRCTLQEVTRWGRDDFQHSEICQWENITQNAAGQN